MNQSIAGYTAHGGFYMSEHEKFEQVGRLAEEVSRLKGELNHVNEKLGRAYSAYQQMTQSIPNMWNVVNGSVIVPTPQRPQSNVDADALLNKHQLIEILEHRQKLTSELTGALERLKGLAPHLF
jgi:hypothetical protein